jgi:hypothetical protein
MPQGRIYSVSFTSVVASAQQDLFEVAAAAGKPVEMLGFVLSQSTEVGDAQEEGLSILVKTGATTTGSGGTAATAVPRVTGDTAFGGTAKVNNTTKATAGTIVVMDSFNWNVRAPFPWWWTPETTFTVIGGGRMTIELATTPVDAITLSGTLYMRELG